MSQFQTVLGIGSALWDMVAHVSEETLASLGGTKGGMMLTEAAELDSMLERLDGKLQGLQEASGGSACNTVLAMTHLGGRAAFAGRRGRDARGEGLERSLRTAGLETRLAVDDAPNGCVLSLVTPDAQRTMFSSLSASNHFCAADIGALDLSGVGLLYLEGYLLFNTPVFDAVMDRAARENIPVALDCGSVSVIDACRPRFLEILAQGRIDILFANEDEASALSGTRDEAALEWIANHVRTAVVKIGPRGALLARDGKRAVAAAADVKHVLDTTAAGDFFAAGFLRGLDLGMSLTQAGNYGSRVAGEVIQVMGTRVPEERWQELRAGA